jgi:monoamine oxidase
MANYIASKQPNAITFNSRVIAVSLADDSSCMNVTVNGSEKYQYSHVISTLPLPVLRSVDMRKAGLLPMQSNALRELTYGPAIKVGMQFKTAWWTTATDNRTGKPLGIVGGQSFTDGMLRTIVYPSFGDVNDAQTTTLIASYCWTDDASRFGALIDNNKTFLVNLVVRELADIHGVDEAFLREQLIDTMSWSWPHDPYTMGK